MYAHGGIVAAAAAILQDMDRHSLLQRLLEQYDPFDEHNLQPDERYKQDMLSHHVAEAMTTSKTYSLAM